MSTTYIDTAIQINYNIYKPFIVNQIRTWFVKLPTFPKDSFFNHI